MISGPVDSGSSTALAHSRNIPVTVTSLFPAGFPRREQANKDAPHDVHGCSGWGRSWKSSRAT